MKKVILAVIFLYLAISVSLAQAPADFRKARWGMTKLEVMAGEELKPVSITGPDLYYKALILGKEMHLIYNFIDNRLVGTVYIFITFGSGDYLEMKDLLSRKYGKPARSADRGQLDYEFTWETANTFISLKPGRGRDCRIEYTSKKYGSLRKTWKKLSRDEIKQKVIENF